MSPQGFSSVGGWGQLITPFAQALPFAIGVISRQDGRILAANATWQGHFHGRSPAVSTGQFLYELFPSAADAANQVAREGEPVARRAVAFVPDPGGATTWWDLDFTLHPESLGLDSLAPKAGGHIIVTAREVTEHVLSRRDAEDAKDELEPIETRLRLAQDAAGIGTWEWDAGAHRQTWSPQQFRLYGFDPAVVAPPSYDEWIDMVHPDDRPLIEATLEKPFPDRADDAFQTEFRIRRADTGAERWLLSLGRPLETTPDGRITRIVGVNLDITARRLEQQKVRESEARLRIASEAAKIFAWDWDVPSGRVTWASGLEAELGLRPGEFGGHVDAFRALVYPDDLPAVEQAIGRALSGETADYRADFRMIRPDGSLRWAASRATVLRNSSSRPTRVIGLDYDITEFKEIQARLLSHERQQAAVAHLGRFALGALTAQTVIDEAARILSGTLNVEFVKVLELLPSRAQLVLRAGTGWRDSYSVGVTTFSAGRDSQAGYLLLRDSGPVVVDDLTTEIRFDDPSLLNDHGIISGMSVIIRAANGSTLPWGVIEVHSTSKRVFTEHDISFLEAVANILTAALQRERDGTAQLEREAWLCGFLEGMPQFAFTASPDGRNEYKNRQWNEYSGQPPEAVSGFGWTEALHPDDYGPTLAAWSEAVATGEPYEIQHRLRGRDGQYRWFLTRAVAARSADDGPILHWHGTSTEISAIVLAREAAERLASSMEARVASRTQALTEAAIELRREMSRRQQLQTALLQSQKLEALGQLTAGVVHDFNNVLSAIQGSFELIERRTREQDVLQIVAHGKSAASRAVSLTRQLLDFGRRDTATSGLVDVAEALRRANTLIGHAIGSNVIRILEVEADTWPVLADDHQLEIALLNLAINGCDAMPEGGTLHLNARNLTSAELPDGLLERDYILISVRDTGEGMPPDILARSTETFFTTKAEGKGTGLGLPMVQAFASRSGGCLRIDSHVGIGTCVEIILPRAAITEVGPSLGIANARPAGQSGRGTILFVEDDYQVRQVTVEYLREQGYIVVEAPDAETAIVLSHSIETLDLLVTDVGMPGATGPDLAERLQAERPDLRILFITGQAALKPSDSYAEVKHEHPILLKPFTGLQLSEAIKRQLELSSNVKAENGDKLLKRLRNPILCAAYLLWRAAHNGNRPPRLLDLGWGGIPGSDSSFTVAVEPAGNHVAFRFLGVGSALQTRLGQPLPGTLVAQSDANSRDDEVLGSLESAYRRCVDTFSPSYEYSNYDFGDGEPVTFERLILPVSDDGHRISHLVGIALFSGET